MTDNKTNIKNEMNSEQPLLNIDDEKLLESFFADCRMDIPDNGFSDRVMAALPSSETEREVVKHRRLEHLWTAACVAIGIIAAVVCQGWEQIQAFFFSIKIGFLVSGSQVLTQSIHAIGQSHHLLMMLAGALVLLMVWGYNEVADAR